jgi:hypothetical protein
MAEPKAICVDKIVGVIRLADSVAGGRDFSLSWH